MKEDSTLACTMDDLARSGFVEHFGVRGESGWPWVFDTRGEMGPRGTVRAPARFGHYHHGYPVPVAPWHDEGGESGGVT